VTPLAAQENDYFAGPEVSISINVAAYPQLARVPGYPVYYAPQLRSNYFFYDGRYWIYEDDNWFASTWYNGPWRRVGIDFVPVYLLRVPVRYYRHAPTYFRGWQTNAPPRWGEHWGNEWAQRHGGWDRWQRSAAPAPAPLPVYQRQYSGDRYPGAAQQPVLHERNYRYQPRDAARRGPQQEPSSTRTIRSETHSAPIQPSPHQSAPRPTTRQSAPQKPEPIQPGPQPVPTRSFAANQPESRQSVAPPQSRQQQRTETGQRQPPAPKAHKVEAAAPVMAAAPAPERGQQQGGLPGQERRQERNDGRGPDRQK
jgi:hypothetical protein